VILPDSSAWIEFLRASGHPTDLALRSLAGRSDVVMTEPVVMELLAGARSSKHAARIDSMLAEYPLVPVGGLNGYTEAAAIHRTCRRAGDTVRNTIDCLIAAVAIRVGASLLHNDRDFNAIARHTNLQIYPVGG
jgi:predicted nucleic acid-binding protein